MDIESAMRKAYLATVQILVEAPCQEDATEIVSSVMRDKTYDGTFVDWAYLRLLGQYLYPTERDIDLDYYEEGDLLR